MLQVERKPLKKWNWTHPRVKMKKCNQIPLQQTELLLKTYTGENINPVGVLEVNVEYKGQHPLLLDL